MIQSLAEWKLWQNGSLGLLEYETKKKQESHDSRITLSMAMFSMVVISNFSLRHAHSCFLSTDEEAAASKRMEIHILLVQ